MWPTAECEQFEFHGLIPVVAVHRDRLPSSPHLNPRCAAKCRLFRDLWGTQDTTISRVMYHDPYHYWVAQPTCRGAFDGRQRFNNLLFLNKHSFYMIYSYMPFRRLCHMSLSIFTTFTNVHQRSIMRIISWVVSCRKGSFQSLRCIPKACVIPCATRESWQLSST